jgi:tetratricopeptide (TPR) repeat protein
MRKDGQRLFDGGNYADAIQVWEKLGRRTSTKMPIAELAEAHFRYGIQRFYESGSDADRKAALKDLERAVELMPSQARYLYHLGLAAQREGDLGRAVASYRKARREPGEFADRAADPLAVALFAQGRDPMQDPIWSSVSARQKSILRHASAFRRRPYAVPDDAPGILKALVALEEGDRDTAGSILHQNVASDRSSPEAGVAHYYLGLIAAQEEDWRLAVQEWRAAKAAGFKAKHLDENMGEALHRFAENAAQAGDTAIALTAAEEAARYDSQGNAIQRLLSYLYQVQGYEAAQSARWELACDYLNKAYEASGGSFRLAYHRALALERAEDYFEAAEAWRETLRRRPRSADHPDAISDEQVARLWRQAAEAYIKAGEYDEALRVYKNAVKYAPHDIETRLMLAEGLYHHGSVQAAQNELERILEIAPDHIPALLLMADVLLVNDQWWKQTGAHHYWERVLELDSENPVARQGLIDYYLEQAERTQYWGGPGRAIEYCEKALAVSPKDPRVLALLGGYHLRTEHYETGEAYLQQALEQAGGDWQIRCLICEIQLAEVSEQAFWTTLEQVEAAEETGAPYSLYLDLAKPAILLDKIAVAQQLFERAIDSAPEETDILTAIGELLLVTPFDSLAAGYFERAVQAGEPYEQAYLGLIFSYLRQGEAPTAQRYWGEARTAARKARDTDALARLDSLDQLLGRIGDITPELAHMMIMALFGEGALALPEMMDFDDEDDDDDWY